MTSLFIEPLDLLLFRDGKPFSAGTDHLARSVFPPFPTTLTGFIRSTLLLNAGLDWERARQAYGDLGSPNGYGEFRLQGMFLRKEDKDFVPVPRDLVRGRDSGRYYFMRPLSLNVSEGFYSNFPSQELRHLWASSDEMVEGIQGYIPLDVLFATVLNGIVPDPSAILPVVSVLTPEPRTNIGINRSTRTADEGRLFTVEFLRLAKGVGFHVRFEGVRWPGQAGFGTLGGEQRPVRWLVLDSWDYPSLHQAARMITETRRFKVVLMTPAIFDRGWQPGSRCEDIFAAAGVRVRLVGAAVGRPVKIGGFDLHTRAPKPIRAAVPAGSVYFYEILEGDPTHLVAGWGMTCVSDHDWEAGMGLSVIGGWEYA